MSNDATTLAAVMAMLKKKNETGTISISAKVKALSEAGFTDAEIDRILEAEDAAKPVSDTEYNEQVEDVLQFSKKYIVFSIIVGVSAIIFFIWVMMTKPPLNIVVPIFMLVGLLVLVIANIKVLPFTFKKARFFLKR